MLTPALIPQFRSLEHMNYIKVLWAFTSGKGMLDRSPADAKRPEDLLEYTFITSGNLMLGENGEDKMARKSN